MKHHHHEMKHHSHHRDHKGMTHFGQSEREMSTHGLYRNEVEKPEMAAEAHHEMGQGARPGMGCMDFKGEADPIAYGQAGGLMKEDHRRIESQFKDYHWAD